MKSIRSLIAGEAIFIRNGERQIVPSVDIVVGAVVLLTLVNFIHLFFLLLYSTKFQRQSCPCQYSYHRSIFAFRFGRSLLTGERFVIASYFIFWGLYSHPRQVIWFLKVMSTSDNEMETCNLALNSIFVVRPREMHWCGLCHWWWNHHGSYMSGETRFKLTTDNKEVRFFTKIISAITLSLFGISIIVWADWLKRTFKLLAVLSSTRLDVSPRSYFRYVHTITTHDQQFMSLLQNLLVCLTQSLMAKLSLSTLLIKTAQMEFGRSACHCSLEALSGHA